MKINTKININFITLSFVAVMFTSITIGYFAYTLSFDAIKEDKEHALKSFRDTKALEIENYFNKVTSELLAISNNKMIVDAMQEFEQAFDIHASSINQDKTKLYKKEVITYYQNDFSKEFARRRGVINFDPKKLINLLDPASFSLQYHYILNNRYKSTEKSKLNFAQDGSKYSEVHKKYHRNIKRLMEKLGFYDIFLIDLNGRIVYTVTKELDFAASLNNPVLVNSSLSEVFQKAKNTHNPDFTTISDFKAYAPSFNQESGFIATPIVMPDGNKVGVLAFQLSTKNMNDIMTNKGRWQDVGLGVSGETYIVGPDYKFRSISRFVLEDLPNYIKAMKKFGMSKSDLGKVVYRKDNTNIQKNNSIGAKSALSGKTGTHIYKDYRGIEVISAYKPLSIAGLHWIILAEMDTKEAFSHAYEIRKKVIIVAAIVTVVMVFLSLIIGSILKKLIITPIRKFSKIIVDIAENKDLTKRLDRKADDELGDMANAINSLLISFQNICKHTIESTKIIQKKANDLKALSDNTVVKEKKLVEKEPQTKPKEGESVADISEELSEEKREDIPQQFDVEELSEVDEQQEEISQKGSEIDDLCNKLQGLSQEFKILEEKHERRSDW